MLAAAVPIEKHSTDFSPALQPRPHPPGTQKPASTDRSANSRMHWVDTASTAVVAIQGGRVILRQRLGRWDVVVYERGHAPLRLAGGLPFDYAQAIAEDYVRRRGASALADPDAGWRSLPASDKQIAVLERRGVAVPADLSRGAASDLISVGAWR